MISIEEYLKDPCGMLSIPFWKWKGMTVPGHMKIIHERDFVQQDLEGYCDVSYFRLRHNLKEIKAFPLDQYSVQTADKVNFAAIAEIINACYADIRMSAEDLEAFTKSFAYDPELWLLVVEDKSKEIAGCAIADFDREAGEGILEWVQVLPSYRKQGVGKLLVTELLNRMQGKASFATVSGRVNNETRPEMLYRSCGFVGTDVWHILTRK